MSRITGSDAKALMEAYAAVYAPQEFTEEQVWEEVENWVNSLVEEGYDLSEYTWEDMYEAYIEEGIADDPRWGVLGQAERLRRKMFGTQSQVNQATSYERSVNDLTRSRGGGNVSLGKDGKPLTAAQIAAETRRRRLADPKYKPGEGVDSGNGKPKPSTEQPQPPTDKGNSKVQPSPAPKPFVKQTGDKAKDMATWAKANPTLAAAAAEKARIRGTQQTDNPLMKDMKSRLPMNSPSVQSPDVAKLGKGNQSLVSNPNAFKAATPAKAVSAAPSTSPAASGSVEPATAKLAATPKSTPVAPNKATGSKKPGSAFEQYDAYDVVLEYLFDNGHVGTVDEAHYVMMEMDAEMIADICEGIDFKGAAREQARRDAEQEKRDKEVPTNKERRLMKGRFRPGASSAERAEGGREALKQKGKVPKKGGKDMFEQVLEHLISEGYAETEEAAREIIANMSDGWKKSIVNEGLFGSGARISGDEARNKLNQMKGPNLKGPQSVKGDTTLPTPNPLLPLASKSKPNNSQTA